jgi:GntR family transcriptional regulator of arabinose operon
MEIQKPKLVYQQIKEVIRTQAKQLEPGTSLGTEIAYANNFNVSRPTIRKAIEELIAEGVVSRIAGIGLQVAHIQKQETSDKKLLIMVSPLEDDDGLFTRVVMGAIDVANEYGYGYHIINNVDHDTKLRSLKTLDYSKYIGVILASLDTPEDKEILECIRKSGIPFILIDNPLEGGIYSYVVADDYAGGYLIGEHLCSLGHTRVLFLSNSLTAETVNNRHKGLYDAMNQNGVQLQEKDYIALEYDGLAQNFILENAAKPEFDYTAIVTSNDMLSMYCLNAFDMLEISIPKGISVAGFGDYRIASVMRHKLTTVRVPGYKMGSEAAKLILESNSTHKIHKIILDVELIVRETTAEAKSIKNI